MTEQKNKAETARINKRFDLAIDELHQKYQYSEGWRIISKNSTIVNLDIRLERSTAQATKEVVKGVVEKEVKEQGVSKETTSKETVTDVSTNETVTTPKTTKRTSKTNTKGA